MALILLPLVFSLIAWIVPSSFTRIFGLIASASTLVMSAVAVCYFKANESLHFDFGNTSSYFLQILTFEVDSLGFTMVLLTNAVVFLVFLSNYSRSITAEKRFTALAFLMQFGLVGVFTTFTILGFYIFWELTLLPIFLILYWFGSFEKPRALLKFFLYTLLGSLAMLLSVIGLMHSTGEISYKALLIAKEIGPGSAPILMMGGFLLAFAVKIPLFPFHTWQAETYTKAPVAGTMLLSAIMLKMALFGLLKWVLPIFDGVATDFWRWPVIILGLIGIVYGAVIAIRQDNLKTLFAYASLSHLGLIAAALMLQNYDTNQVAVVQIVNHSIVAIGLFLAAGIIEQRLGTTQISEMSGIAKIAPRFGFWFAVLTFVSLSVPFTAGFIGEFFLIKDLFTANALSGILASSTLILGAIYMLKAYQAPMFGPTKVTAFQDLNWSEITVFAILSIAAIYLGLAPQCLTDFVAQSFTQPLH
ncbi:MAG: NuoM family protein [Flavobacteriales bacterium]